MSLLTFIYGLPMLYLLVTGCIFLLSKIIYFGRKNWELIDESLLIFAGCVGFEMLIKFRCVYIAVTILLVLLGLFHREEPQSQSSQSNRKSSIISCFCDKTETLFSNKKKKNCSFFLLRCRFIPNLYIYIYISLIFEIKQKSYAVYYWILLSKYTFFRILAALRRSDYYYYNSLFWKYRIEI